jgi:hypothetical protein
LHRVLSKDVSYQVVAFRLPSGDFTSRLRNTTVLGGFYGRLAYGYILLALRTLRVIFIPKPGHDSYKLAKSFRPISLTSFFLKTMERLVDSNIKAGPLKSFSPMESQYAYQRGRSTEAALHDLVQKIESKGVCCGRVSGYR